MLYVAVCFISYVLFVTVSGRWNPLGPRRVFNKVGRASKRRDFYFGRWVGCSFALTMISALLLSAGKLGAAMEYGLPVFLLIASTGVIKYQMVYKPDES